MSSDDKKPKKHFLKAAVAKVFTGSTATSVTDKVVLRFKGHFKKGKTYLQKAVKRDEKAKDERINRAQISDLYKNARILFSLPSCNQLQVIEQIANVIKESKISLLQDTIISNIVLCLHDAVQTAVKQNISNSGAKVVLRCLDLLFYGIELKPTHIKLTSAETIGLILVYSADSDLIMSITNKIILKMQTGSAFSRSVDCYIYACIHKYIHEMRPTEKDIAGILELAQDGSCEFAQTFALNALTILTDTIEHGLIANLFLSTSLSVLMRPMVPTKTVLLAIGQLIFASVKRMQVINRSQSTLRDFFVTLKCGVTILIAQKDEEVQIIGLKILVLLESCDPFSIELKDVLRLIMEFFKSEHEGKIVEAALLLNDILTQDPQFSSELTVSPYFIEKGGFERFFLEIMEHGSQKIRSAIENVLLNVMINTDVYTADKWISVVKRFLFGEGYSTPVLQREPMAEYESDVEKLYGTHLNDEKPITVPDWRTRIFALKLLQALLYKTISASVDKRFPINGVDLSEVIRIAFVATTDNNGKLRCHGLDLFKDILSIFGPVLDPDYSDQSILEQYQTQIVTALIHTFDSNLFIEELNGYEAVITLLKTGIARDSSLLRRLCNALTLKLVYFEQKGFIKTKKIFSFLQTWAEIYCIRYVPKDMYQRLPTETQDFFEQVDACHLEILSTLWLEAINHEWRFQSDSDGTPSSTIASNDWSSIFLALSDRLTKASYQNLKYSNHAIFNTLVNTACHILINDCDVLEDKSNKAYLYSLSILISPSEPFDFNQKEFIEPIAKALSSILSINEQKITNLLPALLSILAITEWQIILDLPDFPTKLTDFIRRIMHSRNYQSILDTYNFFSSFPHQTKLNSIIALNLMTDFSKLMSVENYDIVIKKEEVVGIQMTAKFIEYLAEHIDSDKRSAIRSLLFNSLLHLLIVEVSDFWDQYPKERQNLHNFALTNLHSYASLYPSELKTILSSNNVLAIALKEGLRHQTDYITKNTNTYNLNSQRQPTIQLKSCFRGFENA